MRGGKREGAGRKTLPVSEKAVDRSVRLRNDEWGLLHKIGESVGKRSYAVGIRELIRISCKEADIDI